MGVQTAAAGGGDLISTFPHAALYPVRIRKDAARLPVPSVTRDEGRLFCVSGGDAAWRHSAKRLHTLPVTYLKTLLTLRSSTEGNDISELRPLRPWQR
jgi:hypothetical protein